MEAVTHGETYEWGHPAHPSKTRIPVPLKFGPFLLGGSEPIHELRLIDVGREGIYLTFPAGTALAENEVYRIVRPLRSREDPVLVMGQLRRIVAEVTVLRVTENTRVRVRVLTGSVIKGTGAEKMRGGPGR